MSKPLGASVEVLRRARALIERGWCKHAEARDAVGRRVFPTSTEARSWCALGALEMIGTLIGARAGLCAAEAVRAELATLKKALGGRRSISVFNDRARSKADVLSLYDRAITIAARGAA